MSLRRDSEHDILFPGVILPRERWTRTRVGIPREPGLFDWQAAFGRSAPRVLDLGCGNGRFLIASALSRPEIDHLGIELVPQAVRMASLRAGQRGLTNCKIAWGDASAFLRERCGPGCLSEVHLYHPQPYYDDSKLDRRQLTPGVLRALHAALESGGLFVFQTDNSAFARYAREVLPSLFEVRELDGPWPDAPAGRTLREIVARRRGLAIVRLQARRLDLDPAEADLRAAALPPPDFDANRPRFRRPGGPRGFRGSPAR